jgi:hypothetical protein
MQEAAPKSEFSCFHLSVGRFPSFFPARPYRYPDLPTALGSNNAAASLFALVWIATPPACFNYFYLSSWSSILRRAHHHLPIGTSTSPPPPTPPHIKLAPQPTPPLLLVVSRAGLRRWITISPDDEFFCFHSSSILDIHPSLTMDSDSSEHQLESQPTQPPATQQLQQVQQKTKRHFKK